MHTSHNWNKLLFSLLFVASGAWAFQVEETRPDEKYELVGGVSVVTIGTTSFSLFQVPNRAAQFEASTTTETHKELKTKLSLGEIVSMDEALKVLEIYYKNTAFDFDSIKIRNVKMEGQRYAVWCTNPWLFGCLEWTGGAGTWVEFEVNGKNRSGGMTGFAREIQLIRKFSANISPQKQASPSQ